MINENGSLKERLEEAMVRARNAEAENKILIDRWMLQKMQDAERLNEVNWLSSIFGFIFHIHDASTNYYVTILSWYL